jgi:hypothetical protein
MGTKHLATDQNSYAQKHWRPPVLQKLPIAATAGSAKHLHGDEGMCGGKGDAGVCPS